MKRTLEGIALAGEPLLQQALEAVRAHHKVAKDGASAVEIERLRLLADSLFQTVVDYQLFKGGGLSQAIH
ncbi:hypothetical protein D3C76_1059180 [compost metagenome]